MFTHRILGHMGKSIRISLPLSRPFPDVCQHSHTDHPFTHNDFRILSTKSNRLDLLISESLHIRKMSLSSNSGCLAFKSPTIRAESEYMHSGKYLMSKHLPEMLKLTIYISPCKSMFWQIRESCFLLQNLYRASLWPHRQHLRHIYGATLLYPTPEMETLSGYSPFTRATS